MSQPLLASLDAVLRRIRAADRVFLALDFDGTLSPIVERPEDAVLPPATAETIAALAASDKVTLAILSGRSLQDVRRRVGVPCIYGGNHGLEIKGPGISFLHPDAVLRRLAVDCACCDIEAALGGIGGASVERKGLTATVHFRQVPPEWHGRVRDAVDDAVRTYAASLEVLPARKAWEIRPRVDWNKGAALRFLLGHAAPPGSLMVCAGDDATDERMFEAIADAVSIRVGDSAFTAAQYTVAGPPELAQFLDLLVRAR